MYTGYRSVRQTGNTVFGFYCIDKFRGGGGTPI